MADDQKTPPSGDAPKAAPAKPKPPPPPPMNPRTGGEDDECGRRGTQTGSRKAQGQGAG